MAGIRYSLFPHFSSTLPLVGALVLYVFLMGTEAHAQAVWVEGGGGTPSYALQYEHPLARAYQGEGLHGRVGLGLERARISAPLSLHWVSAGNPHHLAVMAGATPQIRDLDTNDSDIFLFLVSGLGYRYEGNRTPLMLSAMAHPLLIMDPSLGNLIDRSPAFAFRLSAGLGLRL